MKVILGQGNSGKQYEWSRHNLGYIVVDYMAKTWEAKWQKSSKLNALIAKHPKDSVILAKSLSFYNEIGTSATKIINYYKLNPSKDLLSVCDDFNISFGNIRLRNSGSAGGNNGLKSIIASLETDQFARLRIGTGSDLQKQISNTDFVLSTFSREEHEELPTIIHRAAEKAQNWLDNNTDDNI